MNILENELVRKYFADDCTLCQNWPVQGLAWHVLNAMQEPIKNNETYLHIGSDGKVIERINNDGAVDFKIHVSSLRLPDRFQSTDKKGDAMEEFVRWRNFAYLEKSLMNRVEELGQYIAGHIDSKHQPAPEKCDHRNCACDGVIRSYNEMHCPACDSSTKLKCHCPCHPPASPVEAKIAQICGDDLPKEGLGINTLKYDPGLLRKRCRELVEEARKS